MKLGITVREEEKKYFVMKRYLEYFSEFDIIFIYPYNITYACAQCDGFAIVGGDEANPNLYGQNNHNSKGVNDEIDKLDLDVIEYAIKNEKPLFGICRGMQMINIFFKGTLKQNIFNHINSSHKIILINDLEGFPDSVEANSYHHQSVDKLGFDLIPIYYAMDGELEVLIGAKNPVIATQFHPEMTLENEFHYQFIRYFKSLFKLKKQT